MNPITADHFTRYAFPGRLLAGPGGGAAFLLRRANLEKNRYDSDLWLLRGDNPVPLTHDGEVRSFWWTPDGALLFPRLAGKDKEDTEAGLPLTVLYRLHPDEPGEAAEWLRLPFEVEEIVPLENGRLLFTAVHWPARQAALAEAGEDSEKAKELLGKQNAFEEITELPFWENGGGFTGGRRRRLWLWDGREAVSVMDEHTDAELLRPSPSGRYAFFVCRRYNGLAPLDDRLMRLALDTRTVEDISLEATFSHGNYAPLTDDTLLVFGSNMAAYGINQNGGFYRLELPSRRAATLYDGGGYNGYDALAGDLKMPGQARFEAVDESVCFLSTLEENTHLFRIGPVAGGIEQLTKEAGEVCELAAEAGGRILFTALRRLAGPELYALEPGGAERRLTNFNTHLEAEYPLQRPESLSFENSEGTTVQGWVIRPSAYAGGGSFPAILNIHGGPKGTYGTVAFHEMQHWASRGFGVLYCNPTGSDGRGDEFADLRGRYGLVDYDDVMRFLDAALEQHDWIDATRLGVTGGSYGGFLTNWIIGHTGRFRAAVSQRGIANWTTMALTSDIGQWFVTDQIGAEPLDDPGAAWDASPLKYAPAVTTPTLFIHSEQDYRCWMVEALQMYSALKARGVDTRLLLFHGENHELSRSGLPQNRVRRLTEITQWFERHLLDD